MVVANRLAWARRLIAQGVPAFITTGSAAIAGKAKEKIIIDHNGATASLLQRALLLDSLDAISWRASRVIAVDRGHRHASTGKSEICIWLTSHRPGHEGNAGHSDGFKYYGNSDNDKDDKMKSQRPGRSPPSAGVGSDPWHGFGNSDPWAGSSFSAALLGAQARFRDDVMEIMAAKDHTSGI